MEPQLPPPPKNSHHPHLQTLVPPLSNMLPLRSSASTPMTSPGLFSPSNPRPKMNFPTQASSDSNTPNVEASSPYLHPLQKHKVRETRKALIDSDSITGRKLINQYEVIEEIGRGMHGKVKLARNLETGENVAIKIIPRYSKKRRLGKVMAMSPQEKTMREIAILKKMRHPNVVSLLEIIDDPELKKIYLILEHVELGEVVWRKKGLPHICHHERRRIEREARGEPPTPEEEQYDLIMERRLALKELKRAKMSRANMGVHDFWSMEHGASDDASYGSQSRVPSRDDLGNLDHVRGEASLPNSLQASRATSRAPSRVPSRSQSVKSVGGDAAVFDQEAIETDDMETPGPQRSNPGSATALDGTMYGAYMEDVALRGRSPSMADSIISHMSSVDWNSRMHDPFAEDFSYVPCFTIEQARTTFRDTVLGLEYLHYQGVVHRDIKPANLLWTKDHRVKISDFGVSYFGRPIRDGEPDDETVSESEAQDFDDDLELSKTVGTPAFFAPELCYTDADRMEQPKISEMIDIWSLGVTLYCLIYARIPFQAEDEWQMFRKIATEEVFIPRKRLKPVDPSTPPNSESLFKRHNVPPYRDDNELAYEDIDNLLYDLLRQMFTKNPEKRIRLRDIKRHPWIVQGIPNPITWIDDTDPARPSQGRRVQVNDKETAHAVVPIAFLERARSTVKKAVGKLMHPLGDRSDSRTRRRAASSAASSAGDSMYNVPPTPHSREARRKSLKSDDYFSNVKDFAFNSDHPLVHSQTVSPYESSYDPLATAIAQPTGAALLHALQYGSNDSRTNSGTASPSDQSTIPGTGAASLYKPKQYSQSPSNGNSYLMLTANLPELKTLPPTPFVDPTLADPLNEMRQTRGYDALTEEALRARSAERGVFREQDKRAPAQVSVTTASVPGTLHRMPSLPSRPRAMRSVDLGKAKHASNGLASPLFFSSRSVTGYQHGQPQSDSNIYESQRATTDLEERPQTAHRIENVRDVPEARTPPPRKYNNSTPESFARARDELHRKHIEEYQHQVAQQALDDVRSDIAVADPTEYTCPMSPDDEFFGTPPPHGREYAAETRHSSRSASIGGLASPLTSPSDVNSPISSTTPPSKEEMLAFQSDPSLPALLSGSSSVSADLDAEPVEPAVVNNKQALLETTDSLTPPALVKEPMAGFPLEQYEEQERFEQEQHNASFDSGSIPLRITPNTSYRSPPAIHRTPELSPQDDDDDDSDSDEGLLMAKSKKKKSTNAHVERIPFGARRRDTNVSIASTETAKKVVIHGEDVTTYPD